MPGPATRIPLAILACLVSGGAQADRVALPDVSDAGTVQACDALAGQQVPAEAFTLPTSGASIEETRLLVTDDGSHEYCRVRGAIHPVAWNAPDIRFQVNLPSDWNGKAMQFGGSGLNGQLVAATGHYTKQPDSEATPLARGYVTFGSDAGHQSKERFDGRFLLHEEALRNYGHEQIKKTLDIARLLVRARYGRDADHQYFVGGSQGGHEGFDAAQRYGNDYDGIIAGFPAHNVILLHLSANRYAKALFAGDGAGWLNPAKVNTLTAAVYERCDGLDDAADGIISNIRACREATAELKRGDDSNPLRCRDGEDTGNDCLSDAQIDALNVLDSPLELDFSVTDDVDAKATFPKWTPFEGSTFLDGGFPNLGGEGPQQALQFLPGEATPRYAIAGNPGLDTINHFEPAEHAARIIELMHLMSANSPDLDRFRANGGKLIFYHGLVDDFITPYSSIEYFEALRTRYGDAEIGDFVRFYTIPGMGHVTGPFQATLPALDALEAWVENDKAPGDLVATDAGPAHPGRTRPVCRYPAWPRYNGRGSMDEASHFRCVID